MRIHHPTHSSAQASMISPDQGEESVFQIEDARNRRAASRDRKQQDKRRYHNDDDGDGDYGRGGRRSHRRW